MKLKYGGSLTMNADSGALSLRLTGRNDVPRVERKGRGGSYGATVRLNGADVAEFLDIASGDAGRNLAIGDCGLTVSLEWDVLSGDMGLVLYVKGLSVRLTRSERTLLVHAIRSLAWMMFK